MLLSRSILYMNSPMIWSLLVLTLPTENATARMRYWRTLKARGCAVLRDGIYLLPYSPGREDVLRELAASIVESGGTAHLLRAPSFDAEQESYFRTLFDRSDDYASFMRSLADARKAVSGQSPADLARLQRRLRKDYESVVTTDYFPSEGRDTCGIRVAGLHLSCGDRAVARGTACGRAAPSPVFGSMTIRDGHGRRAGDCGWTGLRAPGWFAGLSIATHGSCGWNRPRSVSADVLGFDFDGATFTHVGERVTFEVLLATFGLDQDAALLRLGQMVHALDVGGEPVPEAAGFEAVLAGTRERVPDDDRLLAEMTPVLDALYRILRNDGKERRREGTPMSTPTSTTSATTPAYALGQMVLYMLRLGAFGFGGPVALVGYMHRDLVEQRRWITEADYREGLALAQMMPGPLAAQLGIYLGYCALSRGGCNARRHRIRPAFVRDGGRTWMGIRTLWRSPVDAGRFLWRWGGRRRHYRDERIQVDGARRWAETGYCSQSM